MWYLQTKQKKQQKWRNQKSSKCPSPSARVSLNFELFRGHMTGPAQAPARTCVSISRSVPEDGPRFWIGKIHTHNGTLQIVKFHQSM